MSVYAIGDLQGCLGPLQQLMAAIGFDRGKDRLWFVGDLVNRGPDSLGCLRFVQSLGDAATTVLGNHDLHLLCVAEGVAPRKRRDTLDTVLDAPDRESLLHWLRHRPLLHVEGGFVLVHAAVLPEWSVAVARALAAEVEEELRGPRYRSLLRSMYGDEPAKWHDALQGTGRYRLVINAFTRLRVCDEEGAMVLGFKGEPGEASDAWTPWFDIPGRCSSDHTIVCGHWSALGLRLRPDLLALDSGCVWGRSLTAVRLEDRAVFSVECPRRRAQED